MGDVFGGGRPKKKKVAEERGEKLNAPNLVQ